MSKKDEAFELFSQGKGVDDPELEALELKQDTLDRYYREWKAEQPVVTTILLNGEFITLKDGVPVEGQIL